MNRLLVKIILVVVVAFGLGAVLYIAVNASPIYEEFNNDYGRYGHLEKKVTTESIECSENSNVHTKIDIHRNYGIPRFGIVTDCAGQMLDTVWYMPNNIIRAGGGWNGPNKTDTSITIWWREGSFTVQIMNVLTGDIVLNEKHNGQSASLFEEPIGAMEQTNVGSIEFPEPFYPKKDSNPGTTITYSNLPNGLYWLYILNGTDNRLRALYNIRKGV